MSRKRMLLLAVLLAAGSAVSAQVINGPATPSRPNRPPASGGGIGGIGVGLTLHLGGHKPKTPEPPAWEMRDAALPEAAANQLILVIFGSAADAQRLARSARLSVIEITRLDALDRQMVVAAIGAGDTIETAAGRAARLRGVEWAQPDYLFQPLASKLPRRFTLVGIERPEQLRVHGTIAMIDTPVDLSDPALRTTGIVQTVFGTSAAPAPHGTAIASLLAGGGEVAGMAQGARLVSLAAFDPGTAAGGISQTRYIAKAMDAAWKLRPDVLNLSFGGHDDRLLATLLDALHRRGICMAAAAGNGGPQSPVLFPARHPAVLAVTAVDERLQGYAYAARGAEVAVAGIGVGLLAAVPGGFRRVSGTSFATAAVSGALLRMPACTAAHDPAAMRREVTAHALDLGVPGPDPVFGAGLLRLELARH